MTTSPYPPHESQLTASEGTQHYEFAEGYLHNGAESHYEMEPGDDPEYALPRVTMQPYEVPLSALQQAGQVITHSLPLSSPLSPTILYISHSSPLYPPLFPLSSPLSPTILYISHSSPLYPPLFPLSSPLHKEMVCFDKLL